MIDQLLAFNINMKFDWDQVIPAQKNKNSGPAEQN